MKDKRSHSAAPGSETHATQLGLGSAVPAEQREAGERRGFDFRMPPGEEGTATDSEVNLSGKKSERARVFLKPGELPQWMAAAATAVHPRKSGTFILGSPQSQASRAEGSDAYVKAPLTTSPAPAPYRRPLSSVASFAGNSTVASPPSVVCSASKTKNSKTKPSAAGQQALLRATRRWAPRVLGVVALGATVGAIASLPVGSETRAPGILSAASGPQTVSASTTGAIVEVMVQPGSQVSKGQPLVRIESLQLDVNAARQRRELEGLQEQFSLAKVEIEALARRREILVAERRELLRHRLRLKEDELVNRRRQVREVRGLLTQELASSATLSDARAALQATREGKLSIDTELSALELQQSEREYLDRQQRRQQARGLATAEAKAKDAERLMALSVVRAPVAGWVEAFSITTGAVVQPGTAIARLVPKATPTRIVAFVPAAESSHVREGADGSVRLDSLARTDAQALGARVVRISREVASPAGVEALLGATPAVPMVRVELELLDEPEYYRLQPLLRSGSPVVVSMTTVERRLFDIVWNTVDRWLA